MEILEKAGAVRQSSKRLYEVNRNGNRILANWKNDQINGEAEIYYHNGVTFKYSFHHLEVSIKMESRSRDTSSFSMAMSTSVTASVTNFTARDRLFFRQGRSSVESGRSTTLLAMGRWSIRMGRSTMAK